MELKEKAKKAYDTGDFKQAHNLYEQAIKLDKKNSYLRYEKGMCLLKLNEKEKALGELEIASQLQPNNPFRFSSKAYIKAQLGHIDSAIEDYKKAIELDPEDIIAMNNLGLLEERKGRPANAQANHKKVEELLKKNPSLSEIANQNPNVTKEESIPEPKKTYSSIIKSVFASKEGFKEFIAFLTNKKK